MIHQILESIINHKINMNNDLIKINYRQERTGTRTYKIKFIAEIMHKGLNDYKVLTSDNYEILRNKVNAHVAILEEKWDADERTREAIFKLQEIDNILLQALEIDDAINWERLKDKSKFDIPNPETNLNKLLGVVSKPIQPIANSKPDEPNKSKFEPKILFFDMLFKSRKDKKIYVSDTLFENAMSNWKTECETIERINQSEFDEYQSMVKKYERKLEDIKSENLSDIRKWEKSKDVFLKNQNIENAKIDKLRTDYNKLDSNAILEYCELVLNNSEYPDSFPKGFELEYNLDTKILIVEYSLPAIEQLPTLNEVKFIKNELKEYYISESQLLKMFDNTMYNITLRTIHELFEADVINAIEAISFNGWVNSLNKATGKRDNNCILSIQVKKKEFIEIKLENVDAKTCFKNFKGVGSSKLSGLTPIQPILQINRTDKRFTSHYDVAHSLDSSTNLASMDWEDFEHLIREVFAKEFSSNGGEVRVTQASRDGGVDAIAFDPDPIRGGKIVIQAKRYTNTVGVSSVRDLYGTVMNEGAIKGILVTTADYGPDAYEFVKGKPLTLMNGANLLYLLEKHGHHARIDIKEAKRNMI